MTNRTTALASLASQVLDYSGDFTFTKVQRYTENAAANSDVPFVLIHEGRETYNEDTVVLRRALTVTLEAWAESDEATENRSLTAGKLLGQLEDAVGSDRTLDGDAMTLAFLENEVFTASEQEPSIGVFLQILIRYD